MAAWERQTQKPRRKAPSFSSSLLDAIYHSTDDARGTTNMQQSDFDRRNIAAAQIDGEIENLRRAIMIEKWMENYTTSATTSQTNPPGHFPSNSTSSTDSTLFSSSETESTPKSLKQKPNPKILQIETAPKREGRFKTKALKIYGDLKKVKEPISPGGKISNFLNSIFSPRLNSKKNKTLLEEWSSVRKSRSMKDTTTTTCSRSCLSRNPSANNNKSKRSVRFCPVSVVIVDEDSHRSIYDDEYAISSSVGSQFIKKNIDSFRAYEGKNVMRKNFRGFYENESDLDDRSCGSSDLFELENIGRVGIGTYEEELPVYGTTSLKLNQAIASGLVV